MTAFDQSIYIVIGKKIFNARKKIDITQAQLSERLFTKGLELKRASITNIERGRQKVMLHALYHIAEALEVEIVSLLPSLKEIKGEKFGPHFETPEATWAKKLIKSGKKN